MVYTDAAKQAESLSATFSGYYKKEKKQQSWHLGDEIEIQDAELFAIKQAAIWIESQSLTKIKDAWIFTDSQAACQRLERTTLKAGQQTAQRIQRAGKSLDAAGVKLHIHWVPAHKGIAGNEEADHNAKQCLKNNVKPSAHQFTSINYLRKTINQQLNTNWTKEFKDSKQGQQYSKLNCTPLQDKDQSLKGKNRLIATTFCQLKLGHGYFNSYLSKLPNQEKNTCRAPCKGYQNPEHFFKDCWHFREAQKILKEQLRDLPVNLKTLFTTKQGKEAVLEFIKTTKVATRRWRLGEEEEEERVVFDNEVDNLFREEERRIAGVISG